MPGKVKVRIVAGRNLPVMDKSSDTSDAFVEVKLGNTTYKTEVFRRSLNPYWNSECFRFEVDDEELQDEPLQIRIMDYDTYSANDAIGKVYIDLNPLLHKDSPNTMWGWFPIYDTMHGIRGEVHCMVKVDLFSDSNRYRQSSCGVRFFYSPAVPNGYACQAILGFVEELVVNDDPEYQWIDKIRTPRASNEARQTLFSKLSGEVRRKIGLKALDLGGNSVIGYQQYFDLEGESGIVVRGIGTAVILTKSDHFRSPSLSNPSNIMKGFAFSCSPSNQIIEANLATLTPTASQNNNLPISPTAFKAITGSPSKSNAISFQQKDSSDSQDLNITPNIAKCGSSHSSSGSIGKTSFNLIVPPENLPLLEYPFVTMKQFPVGFIAHIGGTVSSRSVKLLDHINSPEDPETRDAWWTELRKEIRSHCRSLACNAVLGYSESTYICDDVVILSGSGTAVVLSAASTEEFAFNCSTKEKENLDPDMNSSQSINGREMKSRNCPINEVHQMPINCSICHIPYPESSIPFKSSSFKCRTCKKHKVSDVLFMTIEPPSNIPITGIGCLIQARVCRRKRDSKGEHCAKEISDSLPFLEHELHRQLLSKVKVKGMNAIFGLTVQISFGENMLVALATGTAAYITSLPSPTPPQISSGKGMKSQELNDIEKLILKRIEGNKEHYGLINIDKDTSTSFSNQGDNYNTKSDNDLKENKESDTKAKELTIDMVCTNKDACVVLEVDDTEDADIISLMIDSDIPKGCEICNTETMPGLTNRLTHNLQTFSHVYRARLTAINQFSRQFDLIIQSLFVKLRRVRPCCLTNLKFRVDLSEQDLVQITVLGSAIGISGQSLSSGKPGPCLNPIQPTQQKKRAISSNESCEDLLFVMDEDSKSQTSEGDELKMKEVWGQHHLVPTRASGVELTTLSSLPGSQILSYLGNLDFFFIRESTSIRESGGLNGFMHSFLSEVFAIVRAHVAGLGGNAMFSLHLTQCVLLHNPHKNQAQCLVNVAGDAVLLQYFANK